MNSFVFSLFSIFLISPIVASAYEVVDPIVLCDRFISGPEQQKCMKFVKEKKPDTYVSSVCHYLFDDKIFDDCLKLAIRISANPRELSRCGDLELKDQDRFNCIKKSSRAGKTFQRLPASFGASSSGTKVYPESKAGL